MLTKLILGLKMFMWLILFVIGLVVVRYGGEAVYYVPGMIAKNLSYSLTGSAKGVLTSVLFYLVAASFVLAIAAFSWGAIRFDRWLETRRSKPGER